MNQNSDIQSTLRKILSQQVFTSLDEALLDSKLYDDYGVVGLTVEGGSLFHYAGIESGRELHDIDLNVRGNQTLKNVGKSEEKSNLLWRDIEKLVCATVQSLGGTDPRLEYEEGMRQFGTSFVLSKETIINLAENGNLQIGDKEFSFTLNEEQRKTLLTAQEDHEITFDFEFKNLNPTPFLPPINKNTNKHVDMASSTEMIGLLMTDYQELFAQKLLGALIGKETNIMDVVAIGNSGLVDMTDPLLRKVVLVQMAAFGHFPEKFDYGRFSEENFAKLRSNINEKILEQFHISQDDVHDYMDNIKNYYSDLLGLNLEHNPPLLALNEAESLFIDKVKKGIDLDKSDVIAFYGDLPDNIINQYPGIVERTLNHPYIKETTNKQKELALGDGISVVKPAMEGEQRKSLNEANIESIGQNLAKIHNDDQGGLSKKADENVEYLAKKTFDRLDNIITTLEDYVEKARKDHNGNNQNIRKNIVAEIVNNYGNDSVFGIASSFAEVLIERDLTKNLKDIKTYIQQMLDNEKNIVPIDTQHDKALFDTQEHSEVSNFARNVSHELMNVMHHANFGSVVNDKQYGINQDAVKAFLKGYERERQFSSKEIEAIKIHIQLEMFEDLIDSLSNVTSTLIGNVEPITISPIGILQKTTDLLYSIEEIDKLFLKNSQSTTKMAVIAMQFPPPETQPYTVGDFQSMVDMGYDLTIFSPKDYLETPNIPVNHDHGLKGEVIQLPTRLAEGTTDIIWEQNNKIIEAIEQYSTNPDLFNNIVNNTPCLEKYGETILYAIDQLHETENFANAWRNFKADMEFYEIDYRKMYRPLKFIQGIIMANHLIENDISIVYANSFPSSATIAQYAALAAGDNVKWGLQGHNGDITILSDWEIYCKAHTADFMTVTAPSAQEIIQSVAPDLPDVDIVYRGIYPTQFSPPETPRPHRDGSDPEQPVELLLVGRFIEKKGHSYVIDALKKLPQDFHVHVTFVGDGELKESLINQAKENGVEHLITFAGHQKQPEVAEAYRKADILLMPSVDPKDGDGEALNTVIMEAASTRLPCITSDAGDGKAFVLDDYTGAVIPQRDSEALKDAIVKFGQNADFRIECGQNARHKVLTEFDYANVRTPLKTIIKGTLIDEPKRNLVPYAACPFDPDRPRHDPNSLSKAQIVQLGREGQPPAISL